MATKVGPEKDKGSKTRQLSQRSHACFRLSAATVKRDLKGGALRFESTCADDDGAEGRFHRGLSDYCFTTTRAPRLLSRAPVCPATAAAVTWLVGALCPIVPARSGNCQGCRVSGWLRVQQPASAVTSIPPSSDVRALASLSLLTRSHSRARTSTTSCPHLVCQLCPDQHRPSDC